MQLASNEHKTIVDTKTSTIKNQIIGQSSSEINETLIDKELADYWLTYCQYEGQRDLKKDRVLFFAAEMERGNFQPTTVIAFAVVGDKEYLINGQHTLKAIWVSGKSQRLPVKKYYVDDHGEIAQLYTHFDIPVIRSYADMYSAYSLSEKYSLSNKTINYLGSAVNFISRGLEITNKHKNQFSRMNTLALLDEWYHYAKRYNSIVSNKMRTGLGKRLFSVPCFAMGLITVKHQPEVAQNFWYEVATGDIKETHSPTRLLRELLLSSALSTSTKASRKTKILTRFDVVNSVAICWNAFFEKRRIQKIFTARMEESFHLSGIDVSAYLEKNTK